MLSVLKKNALAVENLKCYCISPGLPLIQICYNILVFKMGTYDSERIPLKVFIVSSHSNSTYTGSKLTLMKVVTGILLGLAILSAVARMIIRFRSQRKLQPDDFVLLFACFTLITSQALLYNLKIENLYWVGEIGFDPMNPQTLASILEDPEAFYRRALKVQRIENSSAALTWTSIFAVKICFLLFFYQLITRLPRLLLAWKVIFGITIFFWAYCICTIFISCPHFNQSISKSALPSSSNSATY